MHPGALRALEFDRIVETVRGYAATPMGELRLARLTPSTDRAHVSELLAETTEGAAFLTKHGIFPLRATPDIVDALDGLAVEGRALTAQHLLLLATFLESVEQTRQAIGRVASAFPRLERTAGGVDTFHEEIRRVRDAIDGAGEVVDHASPTLKLLRERLRKQRTRLRGTLESYLRGKETAKYLQDQVVTERNGRYVLVVRAEHRTSIPGIVHGASTSGASLYLEPLSTVEINNDIVAIEQQEQEEIHRILLALAQAFRDRGGELAQSIDAAAALDVIQARARYSQAVDGVAPVLVDRGFELLATRHPLLKNAVPVTIKIAPPSTILLVTGPNTGGKTVALKTAGLLSLMAQAGLLIPVADGSRLPVFQSVFADIGDEQSIDASLSTFSAHISNIASMDRALVVPSLVLLDEVGSGTDPIEGGALGVAIVDHFRRRGATVVATSHYEALKTYASTTEGVVSAAFGFEAATFAPTYQLVYGAPGRSLALEVAARIGLSPSIITEARSNISAREAQIAEHLAKLDRDVRALDHERRLVARERDLLEAAERAMRQRDDALKTREEAARRKLQDELQDRVRQARRDIDAVIAGLKAKTNAIAERSRAAVPTGEVGTARASARAAVDDITRQILEPNSTPAAPPRPDVQSRPPEIGDRVVLGTLGFEATVVGFHDGSVDLDVRGKRMRAAARDVRVIGGRSTPKVNVTVDLQQRDETHADLNVVGCTVDEALARAERFLDQSLLTDQRAVRLIHGYGTGQLKRALSGFLQQHPLVAHFSTAPPAEGGGGVTVVELKD